MSKSKTSLKIMSSSDSHFKADRSEIKYLDGLAGSGKTRQLAKVARQWVKAEGRKVIIAMISKHLIDETFEKYFKDDPSVSVTVIHSDNPDEGDVTGSVTQRLMAFFEAERQGGGQILMITHAALLGLGYVQGRRAWSLIVDETPNPSSAYHLAIPDSHSLITRHLKTEPCDVPDFVKLVVTNRAALDRIARNRRDDVVWHVLRDACRDIANKNMVCYAREDNYQQLIEGKRDGTPVHLWVFAELSASVFDEFREVVIISALFHDTMLYKAWARDHVEWQPVGLTWKLGAAKDHHDNGDTLKIYYALSKDFSKKQRTAVVLDGDGDDQSMTLIENIIRRVENLFAGERFLYSINKDILDQERWGKDLLPEAYKQTGVQLSGSPHGINEYADSFHNVAIISALNPAPQQFAFFKARGIDGISVKEALYRTTCYQIMLRCSLRLPGDRSPKKVVVMDKATADYLSALFPGSQVHYLPNLRKSKIGELAAPTKPLGRPRSYETQAHKQAAYRDRGRIAQRKIDLRRRINDLSVNNILLSLDDGSRTQVGWVVVEEVIDNLKWFGVTKSLYTQEEEEINVLKGFRNGIAGQIEFPIYRSKKTNRASRFIAYGSSGSFCSYLHDRTRDVVPSKDKTELICTTNFRDVEGDSRKMGRANVAFTFGIWFDCDGDSDLTPEEFASWWPHLELVIYATSKSAPDNLRWRAYFPTSMVMDVEVYGLIKDQMVASINKRGFFGADQLKQARVTGRRHGFDQAVWRPETKIYLPAVPRDPAGAYRSLHLGDDRAPIDVMAWIDDQIDLILEQDDVAQQEKEHLTQALRADTFEPIKSGVNARLQALRWTMGNQTKVRPGRDGAVERATERWRGTPKGEGNKGFYAFACALHSVGLDEYEIESTLRMEAHNSATTGSERTAEIPHIMSSLRQRGRI